MISKLRAFSKTKLATVLVAIIIIPFVFWGMGSVFSGGNTNSLAKINNHNISTEDFISHINSTKINTQYLKENIDNEIFESLLNDLISVSIIDIEIKDQNFFISDENLANLVKKIDMFSDTSGEFSRIKYEKFLLENNLSAGQFENRFKKNELKKKLFNYISGGIKSPYFLTNEIYKNDTKKIDIKYIDLKNIYKKRESFTNMEVDEFIKENNEKLKKDYIDFSYAKLDPNNLSQSNEFNDEFFAKIDLIENEILNGKKINEILSVYNINILEKNNYSKNQLENELFDEIYEKRNDESIQLIDKNDYFLIYEIKKIINRLPEKNVKFISDVRDSLYEIKKYEVNRDFLDKIQNKILTIEKFEDLVKDDKLIFKTSVSSEIKKKLFSEDSIKLLYSMGEKKFLLMADDKNNVYLTYIDKVLTNNITKNDSKIKFYTNRSTNQIKDTLYNSYDYVMNNKYNINLNQNTLERFKNHFR